MYPLAIGLGGRVVLAGDVKQLQCFDLTNGKVLWSVEGAIVGNGIGVAPGDKLVWLTIPRDHFQPGLYDLKTGKRADEQPTTFLQPDQFLLGPDDHSVVITESKPIVLRDLYTGKVKTHLHGLDVPIAFTPDGRGLIGYDDANLSLQLWDLTTGRPRYSPTTIASQKHGVDHLNFLPGGAGLLSADLFNVASQPSLRIWDLKNRHLRRVLDWNDSSFTISPSGNELVEMHHDYGIRFRSLDTGIVTRSYPAQVSGFDYRAQMRVGSDGRTLVVVGWNTIRDGSNTLICAWDMQTGQKHFSRYELPPHDHFAVSADGTSVAVAGRRVLETASGRVIAALAVRERVSDLAFLPGGNRLILVESWHEDGRQRCTLTVTEIATGRDIVAIPTELLAAQVGYAFAPDGRRLVTASPAALQVWDSFTGRELKRWDIADRWGDPRTARPLPIASPSRPMARRSPRATATAPSSCGRCPQSRPARR